MNKALVLDTSILCVWLQIPGKDTCGSVKTEFWDYARVKARLDKEEQAGSTFVLPLAAIIETGNYISQCKDETVRPKLAKQFADLIRKTAEQESPWAAFIQQVELWNKDRMVRLADEWPRWAAQGLSMGDATIRDVADYYAKSGRDVEILTGDQQLRRSYQPPSTGIPQPRRRAGDATRI
ncbi:MAG: hypothetical protein H7834_13140 [Magnetococcus sp. YQC-9]